MPGDPGRQPDWVPPGVDTQRANVARVYDYFLGGTHNFRPDQEAARALAAAAPGAYAIARENRNFLGRAIRFLATAGIRQFLDIGSGIPTQGNVHEVAQQADPEARVVYADIDPVAIAHSKAILADNPTATIIAADLRAPDSILSSEATQKLIDFSQPVGLLLVAVLHFISEAEDPWHLVARLRDSLAPGSYLVLSHFTADNGAETASAAEKVYNRSVTTSVFHRSRTEVQRFFDGFDLVDPGVVYIPAWRPDPGQPLSADDPVMNLGLAGVGRKP